MPFSRSVFVTSVHGHSGKVSVKEWFILQQYCYRPHEGDTSGVSDFFFGSRQRKTLPPAETPLPIKDLIQLENSIFTVEWKWQKLICHLRSVLLQCHFFSQKKEVLLWYPLVVYLPVEVCIIPRWGNYPIAFPFISMAVSQLACDLSELRNLLIASLLTNFRHFFSDNFLNHKCHVTNHSGVAGNDIMTTLIGWWHHNNAHRPKTAAEMEKVYTIQKFRDSKIFKNVFF